MSRALLAAWALVGLGSLTSSPAQQPATPAPSALPVPPEQVVSHASQTVDWYRHIVSLEQLPTDPEDVITRDRLYQTALTTVELAFDFGRAAAVLAAAPTSQGQSGASGSKAGSGQNTVSGQNAVPGQNAASGQNAPSGQNAAGANSTTAGNTGGESASLDRAAARLTARVAALQAQLNDLDQQIAQAPRKERDTLTAQRGEVSAALALTREIQDTVTQIERFEESSDTSGGVGASGLAAQIRDLQRSVPEARRPSGAHAAAVLAPAASGSGTESSSSKTNSPPAASSAPTSNAASSATAAAAAFRPESAGVIALTGEWFSLASTRRQLNATAKQTDALLKELESLRTTVTHDVRTIAQQNLAVTSSDAAQIAQAREELDSAAMRFRQLSTLLIPLGEQAISLESARNALSEWRNSLQSRSASVARYLLLRISVLLGSVVIVLIISDVWRRATFRYLHDSRRRMQFLALRRVVVSVALALVIIFGLVSEVGSVATYAGLITAG
ncbi:MAG TPA: hypothetical protein VFB37_00155, partial [Steroidobacteraceae bacterium]|nr:hypothetical protein [Steroidobacteraceae bacterium]